MPGQHTAAARRSKRLVACQSINLVPFVVLAISPSFFFVQSKTSVLVFRLLVRRTVIKNRSVVSNRCSCRHQSLVFDRMAPPPVSPRSSSSSSSSSKQPEWVATVRSGVIILLWAMVSWQLVMSRQAGEEESAQQQRVLNLDAPPISAAAAATTRLRNNDQNTTSKTNSSAIISTTATNTTTTSTARQPPDYTTSTMTTTTSTTSSSSNQKVDQAVLVIASVPYDIRHATALWTQLECFTAGIDVVVLAVPLGGRAIVEPIRQRAMHVLGISTIHIYEFANDRYDVGLWCDALSALGYNDNNTNNNSHHHQQLQQNPPFARTLLLNDSVFAIRHFSGILESLRDEQDKHLVGLSYSNTAGFWLESVFRGFSPRGIQLFMNHSCHCGPDHPSFGRQFLSKQKQKRAIVEYHEIGLIRPFDNKNNNQSTTNTTTMGLFSSDPPKDWRNQKTWVQHEEWWTRLKDEQKFPAAKVNQRYSLTAHNISTCSSQLDPTLLPNLNYSSLMLVKAG
jgi:hypothetical protein